MSVAGAHRKAEASGRLLALALLAAGIAGGGVLATVTARHPPTTALQAAALAAEAAPAGSVSSSWYCPGAPGPTADAGATRLLLANAGDTGVKVSVVVVDERGERRGKPLRLPPHAETVVLPGSLVHGAWLGSVVDVTGGAVSATELVDGRTGRAVASCASEVSAHWYFASGSTRNGSTLRITLFNPAPNLAVVDLRFVTTSSSSTTPAPFQGLVVEPGSLRTLTVGTYVQNQASVATVVSTRAGAIVAGELQLYGPAGGAGVALSLGAPTTSTRWELPSAEEAAGGASELAVFNPSARSEHVVVDARLPAGPVAPFTQVLGPESVWTLQTSQELRISPEELYSLAVQASGAGVVVARLAAGAPHGAAPWWAEDVAVSEPEATASHNWVVAPPPAAVRVVTTASSGAERVGSDSELALENPGRRALSVEVTSWAGGRRRVRVVDVPALRVVKVPAPNGPAFVHADGTLAVVGDASPPGTAGVVGIPAVPLR